MLRLKVEEEEMEQELVELKLKRDHARAKLGGCGDVRVGGGRESDGVGCGEIRKWLCSTECCLMCYQYDTI